MRRKSPRSWLSIIATISLVATLAPGAAAQSQEESPGGSESGELSMLQDARGNKYACEIRASFNDACPEMVSVPYGPGGDPSGEGYVSLDPAGDVVPSPDGKTVYALATEDVPASAVSTQLNTVVVAYRTDTGEPRWSRTFEPPVPYDQAVLRRAAVSRDGRRLYVEGELAAGADVAAYAAALDTETGTVLWQKELEALLPLVPDVEDPSALVPWISQAAGGIMVSPDDGRIYLGVGVLYYGNTPFNTTSVERAWYLALDATSGELRWARKYAPTTIAQSATANAFYGRQALALSPDGSRLLALATLYDGGGNHGLAVLAYDTATGGRAWVQEYAYPDWGGGLQDGPLTLSLSPDGSRVFVAYGAIYREGCPAACEDVGTSFALNAYDATTGATLWTREYERSVWAAATGCEGGPSYSKPFYGDLLKTSPSGDLVHMLGLVTTKAKGCDSGFQIGVLTVSATTGEPVWTAAYDGGGTAGLTGLSPRALLVAPGPGGGDAGSTVYVSAGFYPDDYKPAKGCGGSICQPYALAIGLDGSSGRLVRQFRWIDTYYDIDGPDDSTEFTLPQGFAALSPDGSRLYTPHIVRSPNRNWYAMQVLGYDIRPPAAPPSPPVPTPSPPVPTPSPPVPTPPTGGRGTYPTTPNDSFFGPGEDIQGLPIAQYGMQWGPQKINANLAWQEARASGHGIDVAVLDSGVDLGHEDLACAGKLRIVSGSDTVANDSDPNDESGHGTHVAGIIGACTNNGKGIAGVAPDATIMPIRVLNAAGSGTDAQLIAGIERAAAAGAHVINMSLGYLPGKEIINDVSGIDAAIEAAAGQGVVIVAAAGNDSFPLCEYPALAEDVICVGATDARDNKAWYSTFANKQMRGGPALVAPGGAGQVFCDLDSEDILSLYARQIDQAEGDCDARLGYTDLNGTSMAAPHVAGVVALVYDRLGGARSPDNAQKVIEALTSTAIDLGVPGDDPVYGSGRVDALEAVLAVEPVDPDPTATPTDDPSSTPTDDPSSTPTDDPSSTPTDDPTTDPGPTSPAAPSNLTARAASSSRIELGWSDNSNNETGFAIERSLNGSEWQEIATAGGDSTFHLDIGLDPDTSYFYRVRALNPAGYSPYSNTSSTTTMREQSSGDGANQAPTAPTNLNATSASPSRIDLSWSDSSNNEDGFAVERSGDGNSWQEIATTGRNQTSYLDTGLSADTSYSYRVRAYNSAGHSTYSNVASAKTQPGADGEPSPEPSESSEPVEPLAVGTATTSIAASRELIAFNKGVELSGVVERDDNCTGPLEIEVSRRIHGTSVYEALDSTPVNGAGAWGLQVKGKRNAAYIAQVKETDTCQGDVSGPADVLVRAKIAVRIPSRCGGPIRGRVLPVNEGEVVLQRRAKRRWVEVTSDRLDDRSRFKLRAVGCGLHRVTWNGEGAANEAGKSRFRL